MGSPLCKRGARGDLLLRSDRGAPHQKQIPRATDLSATIACRAPPPLQSGQSSARLNEGKRSTPQPSSYLQRRIPPFAKGGPGGICFCGQIAARRTKSKSPALSIFQQRLHAGRRPLFQSGQSSARLNDGKRFIRQPLRTYNEGFPPFAKGGPGGICFCGQIAAHRTTSKSPALPIFQERLHAGRRPLYKVGNHQRA